MAKAFDLRKQLKLHAKQLLGRLFDRCGVPLAIPWEQLQPGEIAPITSVWKALGENKRQVQVALQEIDDLADSRGMRLLVDELQERFPDRLTEFNNQPSLADKALWVYLECPEAFEQAAIINRAESLRGGQFANRWNSMPKRPLEIRDDKLAKLRDAVRRFYWNRELRGEVCEVHHYRRVGDTDFFFAYLPDWPDKLLAFDTEGQLAPREESLAFNNVFVFDPADGSVELIAKGGLKVQQQLRKAFCKAMLDIDVDEDEPIRQAYQLDHLIDPGFSFEVDPQDRIAAVRTQRLRIVPKTPADGVAHVEIKFHTAASRTQVLSAVERCLHAYGLSRSGVRIQQVSLQLEFLPLASKAPKRMSFKVHLPNTCDLKSFEDEERVVGERCLRRWGVML